MYGIISAYNVDSCHFFFRVRRMALNVGASSPPNEDDHRLITRVSVDVKNVFEGGLLFHGDWPRHGFAVMVYYVAVEHMQDVPTHAPSSQTTSSWSPEMPIFLTVFLDTGHSLASSTPNDPNIARTFGTRSAAPHPSRFVCAL